VQKRISENTLYGALKRMGYEDQLTDHDIRTTISTAFNELGHLKKWVDAQLLHADPDKTSTTYNHAEYVEQRRVMMQDWANRLDMFEAAHNLPVADYAKLMGKSRRWISYEIQATCCRFTWAIAVSAYRIGNTADVADISRICGGDATNQSTAHRATPHRIGTPSDDTLTCASTHTAAGVIPSGAGSPIRGRRCHQNRAARACRLTCSND